MMTLYPPPPRGKKFWNFFHQTLDLLKKTCFAFYSKIISSMVWAVCMMTTEWQDLCKIFLLSFYCEANNFWTAALILIPTKVLRNNPTFRNFLWKNIGGLLWWPPTPPPPGGKKFWNFFSPNIRSNKKNSFCLLQYILFMNGFSATAADDSPTTFWQ